MDIIDIIGQLVPFIIGYSIGFFLHRKAHQHSDEPEHDERTKKIAGNASQSTIIVLMLAIAVFLWGELFGVLKLQVMQVLIFMFFLMLASLIGFRQFYSKKEV